MLIRRFISCIALLAGLEANALPTADLTAEQRQTLGALLADQAGASQWQQLWQRTRQAGHLSAQPGTAYFDLAPARLLDAVALTLAAPDQTAPVRQTQVMYRRSFLPQTVGKQADATFSAICIWVDWRSLPAHALNQPGAYLGQVSLLLTRPCH